MTLHTCARAALLVAATVTTAASAHDTWFERMPAPATEVLLSLGTGNLFPIHESGIDPQYLASHGCLTAAAEPTPLRAVRNTDTALVLRSGPAARTCWAQLAPFEVVLAPDKIGLYLREINASPALRATWADMQGRGLPWKERYTKNARIELGAAAPTPVPMTLDLQLEASAGAAAGPPQAGSLLTFRLLRDGQPLADQPLELRSETSPLGIWRRTDAQGRLQLAVPLPGRWVLRGVDLRLSTQAADTWDSQFITLAFDVVPKPP